MFLLSDNMETDHILLLLHAEVPWLSNRNVLSKMNDELLMFLQDKKIGPKVLKM